MTPRQLGRAVHAAAQAAGISKRVSPPHLAALPGLVWGTGCQGGNWLPEEKKRGRKAGRRDDPRRRSLGCDNSEREAVNDGPQGRGEALMIVDRPSRSEKEGLQEVGAGRRLPWRAV